MNNNNYNRKNKNQKFDGLKLELENEYVFKSIPSINLKTSKIEVLKIEDNYESKQIVALLKFPSMKIVLWEGENYDQIGQWTDSDVINRLKEILNSK